jgi:hypothetical protein
MPATTPSSFNQAATGDKQGRIARGRKGMGF